MARKRNFALPNALKSKVMEVIIHQDLIHQENEDPANYVSLRFSGSRNTLPPLEDVFARHTETHLLLFQEKLHGAASSTRSDLLNLLNTEIKTLPVRLNYKFFHDGLESEQTLKRNDVKQNHPQVWNRIVAIENNRSTLVDVLKNTDATVLLDNCGVKMRLTAKEIAFLSSVLIANDFLKIEGLNPTVSANHKLSGLLSQVQVIDNQGKKRPAIGGTYTYSKRGIRNYQSFLNEFPKENLGNAIYKQLNGYIGVDKIQYILDANEELQKGLGLK